MRMRRIKNPHKAYWLSKPNKQRENTQIVYVGDHLSGLAWAFFMLGVLVTSNRIFHPVSIVLLPIAIYDLIVSIFVIWWTWIWWNSGVYINSSGIKVVTMRKEKLTSWEEIIEFRLTTWGPIACVSVIMTNELSACLIPTLDNYIGYGRALVVQRVTALNAALAFYSPSEKRSSAL
jgi:hypothetical protein